MIHGIFAPLLLLVLAGQAYVQNARTAKITLIETGELLTTNFLDEEEIAKTEQEIKKTKNGEKWLGLYIKDGSSSLIESKVSAKPLVDPENKKEVIGISIEVDQPANPIFLVKGATMLNPGPAPTIYQSGGATAHNLLDTENLAAGKPQLLKLGDHEYLLKAITTKASSDEKPCSKCLTMQLSFSSGEQTQIIYSEENFDPAIDAATWMLSWAGDVDRDGKPDLYLCFSSAAFGDRTELFLSSQAKPDQLLKSVATFLTVHGG